MCFFKAFLGRRKGGLPTFGMEMAFRRSIFVWSSDHAMCFVAILQFRGMMTTQMHFECCSTHSRGVVRCFFVFKKMVLFAQTICESLHTQFRWQAHTGAGRLVKTTQKAPSTRCGDMFCCFTRRTLCEAGELWSLSVRSLLHPCDCCSPAITFELCSWFRLIT